MNYFASGIGDYNKNAVKSSRGSAIKEDDDFFFNVEVIPPDFPVFKSKDENKDPVCFSTGDVAVISSLIIVIALSCALLLYICKRFWELKRRQRRNSSFSVSFSKPHPSTTEATAHFEREGPTRRSMHSQFRNTGTTFLSPDLPRQRHEPFISSGHPAFPGARNAPSSSSRHSVRIERGNAPNSSSRHSVRIERGNVHSSSLSDGSGDYSSIPRYSKIVTKAQIH